MNPTYSRTLISAAVALSLVWSSAATAASEAEAIRLCEDRIRDVYGVSDFRHVSAHREGNNKFMVHGKVKHDGQKHPFDCKVKHDHVKSYHYDGSHSADDDGGDNIGKAVAIGAGLAIIAALAASQAGDDDRHGGDEQLGGARINPGFAEDQCHDELVYRMREEHRGRAHVRLTSARLNGRDLSGEGKVSFDQHRPTLITYTCHLDHNGNVRDSSYYIY